MVGVVRPHFVLFGSSIVQLCFRDGGWGSILTDLYARKADIILRGYAGWNSRRALEVLDQLFPKADIILRGYAGWNSRCALEVLDQVFPKENAVQPSLVIVYFGGNDSMLPHPSDPGPHVPLQEYIENMRKIAIHLKSLSDKTRIIFLTAPCVNEAQIAKTLGMGKLKRTNESCRIYSEACLELCREINVKAIDLWSALQKRDDWLDVCFTDGIHLTSEGSKIVLKEILKVLKEAKWEPSLHRKSLPVEFAQDSPYDPLNPDGKTTTNPSNWTSEETMGWD
ncbi:GDSL esterase/lipase CPRD49 [Senna tora]|uniref:GDSL esterase/lipase CPRD49 n=1 Tax=Senna tora TaxID=362788 RepID=A0A834TN28_9FABA|nr:GDSL esterase/lipase CPRD49 [Senna tora]